MLEFIAKPPNNPSTVTIKAQAKHLDDQHPNDLVLNDLEDELYKFHHSIGIVKNRALAILNTIYQKKTESLYPQICLFANILGDPGICSAKRELL